MSFAKLTDIALSQWPRGPASSNSTRRRASAESRCASAQPADPAPTMMKSDLRSAAILSPVYGYVAENAVARRIAVPQALLLSTTYRCVPAGRWLTRLSSPVSNRSGSAR